MAVGDVYLRSHHEKADGDIVNADVDDGFDGMIQVRWNSNIMWSCWILNTDFLECFLCPSSHHLNHPSTYCQWYTYLSFLCEYPTAHPKYRDTHWLPCRLIYGIDRSTSPCHLRQSQDPSLLYVNLLRGQFTANIGNINIILQPTIWVAPSQNNDLRPAWTSSIITHRQMNLVTGKFGTTEMIASLSTDWITAMVMWHPAPASSTLDGRGSTPLPLSMPLVRISRLISNRFWWLRITKPRERKRLLCFELSYQHFNSKKSKKPDAIGGMTTVDPPVLARSSHTVSVDADLNLGTPITMEAWDMDVDGMPLLAIGGDAQASVLWSPITPHRHDPFTSISSNCLDDHWVICFSRVVSMGSDSFSQGHCCYVTDCWNCVFLVLICYYVVH